MEEEPKKLTFEWDYGDEPVSLTVDTYRQGNRLYVGMISYTEGYPEPFAAMTVNLPQLPTNVNEAYINGDLGKSVLHFIEKNGLGKVLPDTGRSGYGEYAKVAFDLDLLQEFDPDGVARYRASHQPPTQSVRAVTNSSVRMRR